MKRTFWVYQAEFFANYKRFLWKMRKIVKNGVAQIVKKLCSLNLGALRPVLLIFIFEFCALFNDDFRLFV